MITRARTAGLLIALLAMAGTEHGLAHHAASGLYDRDASITIRGRVESVFWRNPHVRFELAVMADDGSEQVWAIEAGSVNSLERMGIGQDVVAPGGLVEVTGLPGRSGQAIAFARSIVSAEGEQIPVFFDINALDQHYELERDIEAGEGAAPGDLFRVWIPVRVPNTGSGRIEFPLTEAARAARAVWDPANDPALRCVPPGMPAAMDNPYPIEFENRGDVILLRLEEWDGLRTIHMTPDAPDPPGAPDAPGAAAPAPSPMGHSVGRWDGDTLVVETSRINYPHFDDLGTPQNESIRVTERFTPDQSGNRLFWTAEIVDPVNFTAPVTLEIEWHWIPGNERKPFDCAVPVGNAVPAGD